MKTPKELHFLNSQKSEDISYIIVLVSFDSVNQILPLHLGKSSQESSVQHWSELILCIHVKCWRKTGNYTLQQRKRQISLTAIVLDVTTDAIVAFHDQGESGFLEKGPREKYIAQWTKQMTNFSCFYLQRRINGILKGGWLMFAWQQNENWAFFRMKESF